MPFYRARALGTRYKPYDLTADLDDDGVVGYIKDRRPCRYQYITQELEDPTDEPFLQRKSWELIVHPTAIAQTEHAPNIKDLAMLAHLARQLKIEYRDITLQQVINLANHELLKWNGEKPETEKEFSDHQGWMRYNWLFG